MTRKLFTLFICLLSLSTIIKAENEKSSRIVFFRPYNFVGAAVDYRIFVNDSLIRVRNNSYVNYPCPSGEFNIKMYPTMKGLHFQIEPGKTYYVSVGVNMGFWSSRSSIMLVDSISGQSIIQEEKLKDMNNPDNWKRPRHRIGFCMDAGGGLTNIPIATTTDGKDVNLSFGKNFAIGLIYAYQFHKSFEYELGLSYESSSLYPEITNGKMEFNRTVLSVTPYYILPIRDGYFNRFRFGAGLDYYITPYLDINMSQLYNGTNDTWTYHNALGYHLSAIYDLYTGKRLSLYMGMKWSNVNYRYKASDKGSSPLTDNLIHPKGGSFCMTLGMNFNF